MNFPRVTIMTLYTTAAFCFLEISALEIKWQQVGTHLKLPIFVSNSLNDTNFHFRPYI